MLMLIPYAVDVPFDRRPVINWLLVGSVVAAFALQVAAAVEGDETAVEAFVLDGWGLTGLIGHMWLHGGIFHLIGNMIFLWVFGNAVCAKVGNIQYIPVYLILGLGAAATHLLFDGAPAVGASGAINGIVGMFLIFFWQNEVDCLFILFIFFRPIIKTFSVSSFWTIGLWLAFDIYGAAAGGGNTAYFAHLGGFFAGALVAVVLLKLNWVTMYRDEESLVQLIERRRQERQDDKLVKKAMAEVEKSKQMPKLEKPAVKPAQEVVRFWCPCGKQIKAPARAAGRSGRCPKCRRTLTIPEPGSMGVAIS